MNISGIDGRPRCQECGGSGIVNSGHHEYEAKPCPECRPIDHASWDAITTRPGCDDCETDAVPCDEHHSQADPVLKAIDLAKWDDENLDAFNILSNCDRSNALLGANRQIEAIRKAYLANQKTAIKFAVETLNDTIKGQDKRIAELEAQLPKVVTPKRWVSRLGDDMFECPVCRRKVKGNLYSHKACQCGAKLNWEDARC